MLYKRGDVWWTKFKHQGQRIRLSTHQRAFKAAGVEARRLRVETEKEAGPGGRARGVTLELLEELDVQRARRKGKGEIRIKTIENLWRNLRRHLGEHRDVSTLTPSDLDRYEGARRGEVFHGDPTRGQTISRERGALRRGLRLAKRDKLIDAYPFEWDELDSVERDTARASQEGKLWPLATIRKVFAKLSRKAVTAGHRRMLGLILETGLRMEEFRRCEATWIHPATKKSRAAALLKIPADKSKTSDPRTLPLSSEAVATIRALWPRFARMKFNHALRLASTEARLELAVTPRDLRAFYLSHASRLGTPLDAQKLGGHSNISTTGLYLAAELERSLEAGVKVAEMIHPKTSKGAQRRGHNKKQRNRKAQ